ncbi:P-loop containing nucleoside triphosphate hydrolase protein [Paraphaeosphaeria sporulosa]|uniref:p-loop containing nucleoside triphosphate hydrolase protein n=1 Tax=Paraphaeosphaeria sporulosa TaxID=1460663 RepID=A0A177CF76_9PLEO|nr:P-loop containing nucleoside triphosphate hydrolase protein [Paraphaeosphaeria sporulosa]OAG06264.1 P-loop containing nucleoside triphosphate hydrolase protein [Paraphaeosphaeria sporulosa]
MRCVEIGNSIMAQPQPPFDNAPTKPTWKERQARIDATLGITSTTRPSWENVAAAPAAGIEATPKEPAGPAGSLASIHNLYADPSLPNKWTTAYPTRASPPAEDAYSLQHALVARYKLSDDPNKTLDLHSIVVQSPLLKKSLGKVLDGYPGITIELQRVEFTAPFECFVHRWDRLQAERVALARKNKNAAPVTAQVAKDAVAHLEVLCETLESELAGLIREKDDLIAHGVMRFENLWTLFEPGCLVYRKRDGHDRVYKLKSAKIENASSGRVYNLECQYVDFDGTNFGYNKETIIIKDFKGTKKIAKFEAYPLEFVEGVEALKARLMERGAMFEAYKEYRFVAYNGIAMGKVNRGEQRFNVKSRIIIDAHSFSRYGTKPSLELFETPEVVHDIAGPASPDDTDDDCVMLDENVGKKPEPVPVGIKPAPSTDCVLTAEQHLVASATVRGYSLRDKKWCSFFIDSICDIVWNLDAFASLVAPQEQKDLILSFAESQVKSRDDFDDFIQGKGQGIIMLLAGPPGVGKTLTAESVAEAMKAPLYSIGAADLGSKPAALENKLHDILEMCSKWNAVLLIDEADVFMEARSTADLERNKLVSIFLRLLEYFSGIMFLTTNRLENMDAAFESRIHLTLNYADLDKPSRKHVWTTFLSTHARAKNANVALGGFSDAELERLSKEKLNGRQIKNVVKTAMLLASRYDECLGMGHLETVLRLRKMNERKTVGFFGGGE